VVFRCAAAAGRRGRGWVRAVRDDDDGSAKLARALDPSGASVDADGAAALRVTSSYATRCGANHTRAHAAVLACGPRALCDDVRRACAQLGADLHVETFEM